eukprot:GHVP01060784.1.p1 GENE.GHVP01060784.1~~GHVP01060784.1.p1  ORF type:complete len:391 (-),score=89.65 GHVP01060784.1:386-1558(-)
MNIGEISFGDNEFEFVVGEKTYFTIPFAEVTSSTVKDKGEIAIELKSLDENQKSNRDYLAEVRFRVDEEAEDTAEEEETEDHKEGEEARESSAMRICSSIKKAAKIEERMGKVISSINDFSCLVPRGRYQLDATENYLRMHGKTYDYKIHNTTIKSQFLLPIPDGVSYYFVVGLEPAIRKGQTRYSFIVAQLNSNDEIEMKIEEKEVVGEKPVIICQFFRSLTGMGSETPGDWKGATHGSCLKCTQKTNDGWLYPLDKSFMFLPNPPTHIFHSDIGQINISRYDRSSRVARSFDIKMTLKTGKSIQFSSIVKNEFPYLENYCKEKKILMMIEQEKSLKENTREVLNDEKTDDEDSDGEYRESETESGETGSENESDEENDSEEEASSNEE